MPRLRDTVRGQLPIRGWKQAGCTNRKSLLSFGSRLFLAEDKNSPGHNALMGLDSVHPRKTGKSCGSAHIGAPSNGTGRKTIPYGDRRRRRPDRRLPRKSRWRSPRGTRCCPPPCADASTRAGLPRRARRCGPTAGRGAGRAVRASASGDRRAQIYSRRRTCETGTRIGERSNKRSRQRQAKQRPD